MKLLLKILSCLLILTLFVNSYQTDKYESESSFLFDMWRAVPGATTQKTSSDPLTAATIPYNFNPTYANIQAEGWLTISSPIFKDDTKYPVYTHPDGTADILTSSSYTRINERYKDLPVHMSPDQAPKNTDPNAPPGRSYFYFRLNQQFLYFFEDKSCANVLGTVDYVHNISKNSIHFIDEHCFNLIEKTGNIWKYCGQTGEDAKKFLCKIQTNLRLSPDEYCSQKPKVAGKPGAPLKPPTPKPGQLVEKVITQPYILIPLPRENCNEKWDYSAHGKDWKCLCKEGKEQSPIDLPPPEKAIGSPVKALFDFGKLSPIADQDFEDKVKEGENLKLQYYEGALRVFSAYLGKTVTMDGGVFHAQEITFHTPSEHKINGEQFPIEMQIKHVGKTVGDTSKHLILSFLFKKSPGVYNKFLESLDIFNLPNPLDKFRDLEKNLFLPNIFFQVNEDEPSSMVPFSFYTYSGSITTPPCIEKTIHYVASQPIGISSTVIELFKEALRIPDLMDPMGGIISSEDSILYSNRKIQKQNGRPIFHYDHKKYNCPTFHRLRKRSYGDDDSNKGHYERRESTATSYFFVEGNQPSGLPGAFVVTEKEALGK